MFIKHKVLCKYASIAFTFITYIYNWYMYACVYSYYYAYFKLNVLNIFVPGYFVSHAGNMMTIVFNFICKGNKLICYTLHNSKYRVTFVLKNQFILVV